MTYYPRKARTFHLRDDASSITNYKRLAMLPQAPGTEATLTGASSSSAEVLIGSWSSDALACISIPAGVWRFKLYAKVDSATDTTNIKIYAYSRDQAGTETALFNVTTAEINNTTVALVDTSSASQAAFTVADTDRLVIKLYAVSNSGTDKTVTIYYQGATNYSHILIPDDIPVRDGDMTKEVYDADGDGIVDVSVFSNPMTTEGDIIIGGTDGDPARLGIGTDTYVLTSNGTVPTWAAPDAGFTNPMTTEGDLIIGGASGTPDRLGIGTNTYVLTSNGTTSGWAAPTGMSNPMTTAGDLILGGASGAAGRLAIGTDTYVLTSNGTTAEWAAANVGTTIDYICIQDQKTQNTYSGTFTSGAWRTRDLNTEVSDTGNHASVASNQITLEAGTYICFIRCPAFMVNRAQAKLYNVTDSTDILIGSMGLLNVAYNNSGDSFVVGKFTISGSKVLEVRHICQTTYSNQGFGIEGNFGTEIYTSAEFWKVA